MKLQIFKAIATTVFIALLLFILNKLILENTSLSSSYQIYQFSLVTIYLVLALFSIAILITLYIVNAKNKDIVGMTFLLLTTIKTGIYYFIFSDIVTSSNRNSVEKINFFMVFILFLAIETLINYSIIK